MKAFHTILAILGLVPLGQFATAGPRPGWVVGWGANAAGQAAGIPTENGPKAANTATGVVAIAGQALTNAVAISAGMAHGLALRSDGTIAGWGGNLSGDAVGYETEYPFRGSGAVMISGHVVSNVTAIAAGRTHSLALLNNGTVVAWGLNQVGQVTIPGGLSNQAAVAISAGDNRSAAVRPDGTVLVWGEENRPPPGLANVAAVALGHEFYSDALALRIDGTVVEWNLRGVARLRSASPGLTNVVDVSAGWSHYLALKSDGTVFGWGSNGSGQANGTPNPASASSYTSAGLVTISGRILSNVVAIAAGNNFSLGLKGDGTIAMWGRPLFGWMGVPLGLSNVVAVAAGEDFCLAITTNKSVADYFGAAR